MSDPVLEIEDLAVEYATRRGPVRAVDGVSLRLQAGEILGLVGESGSGKSVTGLSIMGLVDAPGRVVAGSIRVQGQDIVGCSDRTLRGWRGRRMAMIFQDPMSTLTPVLRIDTQIMEAVQAHERVSRAAARARALEALQRVGIPAPKERLTAYPHQLSGGMRQRVAIAIALLHRPALLVADEPTTALDVTIQSQILGEVQRLCAETGTALIWITHDLSVVAGLADRIAVMYAGRLVEVGGVDEVLDRPLHPYTSGLIGSSPSRAAYGQPLAQIPGMAPTPLEPRAGCAFAPRCSAARPSCAESAPALTTLAPGRHARCHWPLQPQELLA